MSSPSPRLSSHTDLNYLAFHTDSDEVKNISQYDPEPVDEEQMQGKTNKEVLFDIERSMLRGLYGGKIHKPVLTATEDYPITTPFNETSETILTLSTMKKMILDYKQKANWIKTNRIPLCEAKLSPEDLVGVTPFLKFVDLRGYQFPVESDAAIQQFISRFKTAETLLVSSNTLSTLPLLRHLRELDCSDSGRLETLPIGLTKLEALICNNCHLKNLPYDLKALRKLICFECPLETLPNNLIYLQELNCRNCPLKTLPSNIRSLRKLECIECPIEELPNGLCFLEVLACINCPLKTLPSDLYRLKKLFCSGCPLQCLPLNLKSLELLHCDDCLDMDTLPEDLSSLTKLDCSRCPIKTFPQKFRSVKTLLCVDCKDFQGLPDDLKDLEILFCSGCEFTSLPRNSLSSLKEIYCYNSKLKVPADLVKTIKVVE